MSSNLFTRALLITTCIAAGMQACGAETDTPTSQLDAATGLDASVADARPNPTDSGVTDAAVIDSGPLDAGALDAGAFDAADAAFDAGTCAIGIDDTVMATLKITADDYLKLYVNGALVDDKTTTWGTIGNHPVTLFRHPSRKNVIAVDVRNAFAQGGLDRGLLADLSFAADAGVGAQDDAGVATIVTDTTWKMPNVANGNLPDGGAADAGTPGWFGASYDDSAWIASIDQGAHGISPYGAVFGTSSAHWLWSYDVAAATSKTTDESVYFRKSFYFSVAGAVQSTPATCP